MRLVVTKTVCVNYEIEVPDDLNRDEAVEYAQENFLDMRKASDYYEPNYFDYDTGYDWDNAWLEED